MSDKVNLSEWVNLRISALRQEILARQGAIAELQQLQRAMQAGAANGTGEPGDMEPDKVSLC